MQKKTTRFTLHVAKTGRSLHQCQPDIDANTFLHDILIGIGNSYASADLIEALVAQWSEDELL
eukprot:4699571-Prorocentrum_lima.AAC.1